MADIRERLKAHLSRQTRRRIVNGRFGARYPTAALRALPDFLVIGGQRCGTSSLYRYLGSHPSIFPSLRKETEYFSRKHRNGVAWYRGHFPLRATMRAWTGATGRQALTFEATPDYLFYPYAPARAAELVPHAKIVVLLRDPVERAWSHYQHMVRLGYESLSFEDAIASEEERVAPDMEALRADPLHYSGDYLRFSYLARGMYAEQLERWLLLYPADRVMIARSEDFFVDPARVHADVLTFLGASPWRPRHLTNFSYASGSRNVTEEMPPRARRLLEDLFAPHNERLAGLVGRDFEWTEQKPSRRRDRAVRMGGDGRDPDFGGGDGADRR